MLLSRIEDLVESDNKYEFSFQIYEELIGKWLAREARKPKVNDLFNGEASAMVYLSSFSEKFALYLYENREKHDGYFLPKGDKIYKTLIDIPNVPNIEINFLENIAKGKSLLNRDAKGNYKFSHKSVLEYFLANKLFESPSLYRNFNFQGMDATDNFFKEMLVEKLKNKEGKFAIFDKNHSVDVTVADRGTNYSSSVKESQTLSLSKITIENISKIEYLKIEEFQGISPLFFSKFSSLKELVIIDWKRLDILYLHYQYYLEQLELIERQPLQEDTKVQESQKSLLEVIEFIEREQSQELREMQELVNMRELREPLQMRQLRERLEQLKLRKRIEMIGRIEMEKRIELIGFDWLLEPNKSFIEELKIVNQIIKEIQQLQKMLPNCEIYY